MSPKDRHAVLIDCLARAQREADRCLLALATAERDLRNAAEALAEYEEQ